MPVQAADRQWSVVSSAEDLRPKPGDDLISLMLEAAQRARFIDLAGLASRMATARQQDWLSCWPGEHYRLLAGLVDILQPTTVIEIGTGQGIGALSLADRLPSGGRVVTYDIIPWTEIAESVLRPEDFSSGRIEQRRGDLSDPGTFERELPVLRGAELIFSDASKDGVFESALLTMLLPALVDSRRLLVLDDIRLLKMLQVWRDLPLAKLDATSVGHWSGTGLAFTV
jgi:predicted O-methyltransferase YrrM